MIIKILRNPVTIIISIVLGSVFGVYFKDIALAVTAVGQVYLSFFQMTVIPILITAIVSSLAVMMKDKRSQKYLFKLVVFFLLALIVTGILGAASGIIGNPGKNLDDTTMLTLNKIIKTNAMQNFEMALKNPASDVVVQTHSIGDFFKNIVPSNIFTALGSGQILGIVFFSIIFGIALGFIDDKSSSFIIDLCNSLLKAFQKLVNWTVILLPFGLIFLIGSQIATVGVEIFLAMIKFIVVFYGGGLAVFLLCTIVIMIRSGTANPFKVLGALTEPMILAIATRNSFATLPASINSLTHGLSFNTVGINLVLPLGMTILRFGNIFYFALASCFVMQLYGFAFTASGLFIVLLGSVLAGTATAGSSGLLTLPMLALILTPMGLPVEAILIVFMAIDSIIDPMRTFLIVYCNITTAALVIDKDTADENKNP